MSLIGYSPFERVLFNGLSDLFEDFQPVRRRRAFPPYWRNISEQNTLAIGNALGELVDTPEKFSVSVDVSHFKPEEIRVNVAGNELTIEGEHEERCDRHGTIQRAFIRKYTLPEYANLESLRSSLSDAGHLKIETTKKSLEGPQARAIPIARG